MRLSAWRTLGYHYASWRKISLRLLWSERERPTAYEPQYRRCLAIDLEFYPNLLWFRHLLGTERGVCIYQDRLCGVLGWRPIRISLRRL